MLNVLGIASTVKKGWRRIHSAFGGFGLFSFATKQLIERLNLLLQHYNTGSSLSKKLDASLRYLQLQLGTNICPLDLPYDTWAYLAPLSWVKMLWRTLQVSGFTVHLTYTTIPLPRRGDYLIMEYALSKGATNEERSSMSRVRGLLCSLFVSDIVTADGKHLEGLPFSDHTAENTHLPTNFPRNRQRKKIGQRGRIFGSSTQLGILRYQRH